MNKIRCAIYTRKSSEEGLDQEFNSLHAQREACAAYIASQKHEGWVPLPQHYDDGGISGGTLERAGLKRLLQDVDEGLVDQIVVYKIDRLTRSLADFAKLVDRLDAAEASFVSVTQSFNTATSMGRLTLNVLLSFAQFEREVTAERIRDKIAASKKKGLWMGGSVPLGYEPDGRTLKIVEDRLTPSHTNKKGRRYRYYVSNRLISGTAKGKQENPRQGGWRLPAKALEQQMADVVLSHLRVRLPIDLLGAPSTETIAKLELTLEESGLQPEARALRNILSCIKSATIKPGQIDIELDSQNTANCLGIAATELNVEALTFTTPFQLRKRGVETKLVIGAAPLKAVDTILIRSIAKAHQYYEAIKQGQTFEDIADRENLSKRRILQVVDLAFLAPDIIKSIAHGDQPIGLTAKWLGLNPMPSDWQAQRRIATTL